MGLHLHLVRNILMALLLGHWERSGRRRLPHGHVRLGHSNMLYELDQVLQSRIGAEVKKNTPARLVVLFVTGCLCMALALWCLSQSPMWVYYATWPLAAIGGGCLSTSLQGMYQLTKSRDGGNEP